MSTADAGVICTYNTPLFALFVLVELDTVTAATVVTILEEFDFRMEEVVKVQSFARKYAGRQAHVLPIFYLLFERIYLRVGVDTKYEVLQQNVIMETLAKADQDVYATYDHFMYFLLQLLSVDELDLVEYLFWLLTKAERSLDRGEVAMLLQMILGDRKDDFVTRHKAIIEKLLVEQGSELIVLNRFQLINASFGGVFTRAVRDLQQILTNNLLGGPKVWKDILPRVVRAFYTHQADAYERLRQNKHIAVNRTLVGEKKFVRKEVRKMLRLLCSYHHFKENTTLLFKGKGGSLSKWVAQFWTRVKNKVIHKADDDEVENGVPHNADANLAALETVAIKAARKKKQQNTLLYRLQQTFAQRIAPKTQQELEEEQLKAIAQMSEAELDPFAFEHDFAYTLDQPVGELMHECRDTRRNGRHLVEETQLLLDECAQEMQYSFESMGLSYKQGGFQSTPDHGQGVLRRSLLFLMGDNHHAHHNHNRAIASFASQATTNHGAPVDVNDDEAIMRAVEDLGRRFNTSSRRRVKSHRRRSFLASFLMNPHRDSQDEDDEDDVDEEVEFEAEPSKSSSTKRKTAPHGRDEEQSSSSDEDVTHSHKRPTASSFAANNDVDDDEEENEGVGRNGRKGGKSSKHSRKQNDREYKANNNGDAAAASSGSRKRQALQSDLAQAKGLHRLSSFLSHNPGGTSSRKLTQQAVSPEDPDDSAVGADDVGTSEKANKNKKGNNDSSNGTGAPTTAVGTTGISRLNQWKAQQQQKDEAHIEAESRAIEDMRMALMAGGPEADEDEDDVNEGTDQVNTESFSRQSSKKLPLSSSKQRPLSSGKQRISPLKSSSSGKVLRIGSYKQPPALQQPREMDEEDDEEVQRQRAQLQAQAQAAGMLYVEKNAQGQLELTEEQRFAADAYAYEQHSLDQRALQQQQQQQRSRNR